MLVRRTAIQIGCPFPSVLYDCDVNLFMNAAYSSADC